MKLVSDFKFTYNSIQFPGESQAKQSYMLISIIFGIAIISCKHSLCYSESHLEETNYTIVSCPSALMQQCVGQATLFFVRVQKWLACCLAR